MGVKFQCPNGHQLHVKAFLAGKRGKCPRCGASVVIPLPSEPPAAAKTVAGAPPKGGSWANPDENPDDSTDTIIMDEAEQAAADAAISGKSSAPAAGAAPKPPRMAVEELGFAPEAEREKAPAKPAAQEPPPLLLQVRPRGPVDDPLREAIVANRAATEATFTRNQRRSRQQTTTLVTVILLGLAVILGIVFLVVFIGSPNPSNEQGTHAASTSAENQTKLPRIYSMPNYPVNPDRILPSNDLNSEAVRKDLESLQGEWTMVSGNLLGSPISRPSECKLQCKGDEMTGFNGRESLPTTAKIIIDPSKNPKTIDFNFLNRPGDIYGTGNCCLGVYELDGDTLKICHCPSGGATHPVSGWHPKRPADLSPIYGIESDRTMCLWHRDSK